MSLFTAQLHPGRALGFLVLGASLHDVLTRLKSEPQRFPKIDVAYSPDQPVSEPVCVSLPLNGLRLRFDGPEQRLRLIEVTDFTKNHVTFKDRDLMKPSGASASDSPVSPDSPSGPTFRHIYHRLMGPTFAGEFIPPPHDGEETGIYVLSYPGVAFNFSLPTAAYSPSKDVVSLLSASSNNQTATSMAIFSGDSWADARPTLWTQPLPSVKATATLSRGKDVFPDEVSLARLHGGGKLQLFRKWTSSCFWLTLGETTPQELVAELGPPNAMYRKNDQKLVIHQMKTASNAQGRSSGGERGRLEDLTDTDRSSMNTGSDDSDDDVAFDENAARNPAGECFYNYFHLGIDILVSTPVSPSSAPPGESTIAPGSENMIKACHPDRLVATKLILHGNIPGSYEFNRHRRCRWDIAYLNHDTSRPPISSETEFANIEQRMTERWAPSLPNGKPASRQRGMVLNRGWGDSPGSSCELLGGWEESGARRTEAGGSESTTTLYGFPGMVFEVLRNGFVNTVTVF